MLLDARNDLFEFQFPKTFFPQEIRDKWVKYVRRAPSPIQEVPEFLNFTIQGVNTSSLSYDPAEQSHTQRKRQKMFLSCAVSLMI
jgi:hypothetical protein